MMPGMDRGLYDSMTPSKSKKREQNGLLSVYWKMPSNNKFFGRELEHPKETIAGTGRTYELLTGRRVERVSVFKFLGVHISEDFTWSLNSSILIKEAQQCLYFLRSMKKAHLCPRILTDFYRRTIESILTNCLSVWYGNYPVSDHKALQQVVKTAQRIIGTQLPTIENIYHKCCLGRAKSIIKDASHPNHGLFTLLPSGKRYRSLRSHTSRYRKSFFPEAVTLLNLTSQR
ncbi:uncharacterized protein [Mobula birostris]|uniref:uncharacterized protein isoform X3 n=1 Tax=Mobula birostris TaxID=1983395 RepID=UPI003B2856F2